MQKIFPAILFTLVFLTMGPVVADRVEKSVTLDFLMGKFKPRNHPSFVRINQKYANKKGMYLQKEAYEAFKKMHRAALKEGVRLQIRSATRTYNHQKIIWERKWTGKTKVSGQNLAKTIPSPEKRARKILHYSSMPGSSRHHWGTDIDLNSFSNKWFSRGKGLKLYNWLNANASKYGFCQVYSSKDKARPHGYEEEKWHWSYIPLASRYTERSAKNLLAGHFSGFKGSNVAQAVGIVDKYVLGINPECQ